MIQIIKPNNPKPAYKDKLREYKESKKRNYGNKANRK
jgi:hypothetical protein